MNGKRIFEAMSEVDDRYLTLAENFRKETDDRKGKKPIRRKSLSVLLAAVICISMLAVTAMAEGWIPGIFRELTEAYPQDAALFEAAAQANTEIVPEFAEIPQLDMSKFVLLEKYYDGEAILMGYDLDVVIPEPAVGIQPDKELMRRIRKGVPAYGLGWDMPEGWQEGTATENAQKYHLSQDAFSIEEMMKGTLSDAEYKRAWELLESQGWVCLATRDVTIGDHILINGHEYYDPQTNPDALRADYETEYGDCIRLECLPQQVRDQKSVTVTLKVNTSLRYWYMDLESNGWVCWDGQETQEVSFELENVNWQPEKEDAQ